MNLKDRVTLNKFDKYIKDGKGTVVKLQYKNNEVKTACVLWDKDWPGVDNHQPRVFYYKPTDLNVVDTWSL